MKRNGLKVLQEPETIQDEDGFVIIARISGSGGSIVHTLIQSNDYKGSFLPGYSNMEPFDFCATL